MAKKRRRRVSFDAKKMVNQKRRVTFVTKDGKKVSFSATRKVPVKKKVVFYAKKK